MMNGNKFFGTRVSEKIYSSDPYDWRIKPTENSFKPFQIIGASQIIGYFQLIAAAHTLLASSSHLDSSTYIKEKGYSADASSRFC